MLQQGNSLCANSQITLRAGDMKVYNDYLYGCVDEQEDQEKLFKGIVQFNAAKLQDGKGSGLGLWSECCS